MDFSSFFTSLGTSFVIFVVLMLLFTWLLRKPGNNMVYYNYCRISIENFFFFFDRKTVNTFFNFGMQQ